MRLFVALELDSEVREALCDVQRRLQSAWPSVRWVNPDLLHMTIKFLGEVKGDNVTDRDVPTITNAITQAASDCPPFTIALDGCACFPRRGPVRAVWAGVRGVNGSLQRCAKAVDASLAGLGSARENRIFSPHITLGRLRDDRSSGRLRQVVGATPCAIVNQEVGHLALMSSVLAAEGPTYTTIHRAMFGKSEHKPQSNGTVNLI